MLIQIDFYKDTGKWYSGGTVEIKDDTNLFDDDFKEQILVNQNIMDEGWWKNPYIVVTSDHLADSLSPNYRKFFKRLFYAIEFEETANAIYKKN